MPSLKIKTNFLKTLKLLKKAKQSMWEAEGVLDLAPEVLIDICIISTSNFMRFMDVCIIYLNLTDYTVDKTQEYATFSFEKRRKLSLVQNVFC